MGYKTSPTRCRQETGYLLLIDLERLEWRRKAVCGKVCRKEGINKGEQKDRSLGYESS